MAGLDDVTQGYIDGWNELVDGFQGDGEGKVPTDYLTDKVTSTDNPTTRARQMGRRLAAFHFSSITPKV